MVRCYRYGTQSLRVVLKRYGSVKSPFYDSTDLEKHGSKTVRIRARKILKHGYCCRAVGHQEDVLTLFFFFIGVDAVSTRST